jgi:hypothetical protein
MGVQTGGGDGWMHWCGVRGESDPLFTPGAREWKVLLHPDRESRSDEALCNRLWPLPGVVSPFFRYALLSRRVCQGGGCQTLKKENFSRGTSRSESQSSSPSTVCQPQASFPASMDGQMSRN